MCYVACVSSYLRLLPISGQPKTKLNLVMHIHRMLVDVNQRRTMSELISSKLPKTLRSPFLAELLEALQNSTHRFASAPERKKLEYYILNFLERKSNP